MLQLSCIVTKLNRDTEDTHKNPLDLYLVASNGVGHDESTTLRKRRSLADKFDILIIVVYNNFLF